MHAFVQEKAVDDVSFILRQGECLGLVGGNNSGKSTILALLTGQLTATGGNAYMADTSLNGDLRRWQQQIGYASDNLPGVVPQLTGGEMLLMMARLRGVEKSRQAVAGAFLLLDALKADEPCFSYRYSPTFCAVAWGDGKDRPLLFRMKWHSLERSVSLRLVAHDYTKQKRIFIRFLLIVRSVS